MDFLEPAHDAADEHHVTDQVAQLLADEVVLGQRAALVLLATDANLRARLAALLANDPLLRDGARFDNTPQRRRAFPTPRDPDASPAGASR